MLIDHQAGRWVAKCTFQERTAFQGAGWVWDKTCRAWTTDVASRARVFEPFATDAATKALQADAGTVADALSLSYALSSDIEVDAPPGLSYDPHQLAAIEYASDRKSTLCADPPGLGKTMVAIGLSNYMPHIRRVMIVCPVHLRVNWQREWTKWCVKGLSVGTARSTSRREKKLDPHTGMPMKHAETGRPIMLYSTDYHWPGTDVVICNYDMLPAFETEIRNQAWDLLVVDESHYLINPASIRARQIIGGGKQKKTRKDANGALVRYMAPAVAPIKAGKRLFLTGSAIMSRPLDLWPTVSFLDPEGLGKNWKSFTRRYCGGAEMFGRYDVTGSTNEHELQAKLRKAIMVRRDKKLAMANMPPKRRQLLELPAEGLAKLVDREVSAFRQVRDALAEFEASLRPDVGKPEIEWTTLAQVIEERFGHLSQLDYADRAKHLSPPEQLAFEELSTARKELAAAKIPMVIEHLKDLLSSDEKVVVFTVHTEMAEAIRAAFPDCAFVTGRIPTTKAEGSKVVTRQDEVDRFQNDESCRLFVGNMRAAGTGYTLTAACIVVCAELDWVFATVEQAEDRCWRRGQTRSVLAQHLVVEGSSDARLVEVFLEKQQITRNILDFDAIDAERACILASTEVNETD